jgi:hypothetical protein
MAKDTTLRTRVDTSLALTFETLCSSDEKSSSQVLRTLIEEFVFNHPLSNKKVDIDVTVGKPYGRGAADGVEYEVTARLTGEVDCFQEVDVNFLLPEFRSENIETFRIDSFNTHRTHFPGCRNSADRLLGAKLIHCEWKGAIFLYKSSIIADPLPAFDEAKDALKNQILKGVSTVLKGLQH